MGLPPPRDGVSEAALRDAQNVHGVPSEKCRLWRYSMPDPARWLPLRTADEREDLVVCASRLYPSKGQEVLITALAQAVDSANSTRIEFLGSGPMLDRYLQMAEQSGIAHLCHFAGLVSNEEVLQRMSRAKITVVPSHNEAFGLVNLESMAVGTPVIASRVGGIPEIVRDGVDGFLVPAGDSKALAEKLGLLLRDSELRERLGRNARNRFLEQYDDSSVVQKQADWLHQFVWK
jgi:glycosyltransferase involved in cell wall biosynthesis